MDPLRDRCTCNAGARDGYLETFAWISAAELSRGRGASSPSLVDIFVHSLDAVHSSVVRASRRRYRSPQLAVAESGGAPSRSRTSVRPGTTELP
jgi:hypothetical protein